MRIPKFAYKAAFNFKKFSPEILTAAGVIGVGATVVLASRQTLKLEEVVTKHEVQLENANFIEDEADQRKRVVKAHLGFGKDLVKLYGPTATLGVVSIGCLLGAHGIMRKRNVAILAAYKATESAFTRFKERVTEELGVEKVDEILYGKRDGIITEKDENDEDHKMMVFIEDNDPRGYSQYAQFFDEGNVNFKKHPGYNLNFLRAQQQFANDMLAARGYLYLNDVYDSLGLPRTKAGAVVGWMISKDHDNYVSFGLYDGNREAVRAFVNGDELSILLDFNVDGVIWDKVDDGA